MVRPGVTAVIVGALMAAACGGPSLLRQYEYEEEVFLDVDGSATVVINSSIPALVELRGLDLDPAPRARLDRRRLEAAYTSPATRVLRVSRPWRRAGRRFVQVRIQTDDVRRLAEAAPLAWSAYRFDRSGDKITYRQTLGAASGPPPADRGDRSWTGEELIAVRVHVPSRILYHNVRRLEDNQPGQVARGNILTWEQRLADRLAGAPLEAEARFEPRSILAATLWVFAAATAAALAVLAGLIWWTARKQRPRQGT
jgi:hypothetical protein